jgi:hypothetical protein
MKARKGETKRERLLKGIKEILNTPKGSRIMPTGFGTELKKWIWSAHLGMTTLFKCPKCRKKNQGIDVIFAEKGKGQRYRLGCGCGLSQKEYEQCPVVNVPSLKE